MIIGLENGLPGKVDILNLEWPCSDRDLHIVTPVLLYLRKKYHITFTTKSIFNGYYYILKYRPKMLLISNFSGDKINHEIVRFAYRCGIKVVSFISEGNVKKEAVDQFLWGWNSDKKLFVDKIFLWSERSKKLFYSAYPEYEEKFYVTGATGFDRYKLLKFKTKETFLQENNLKYKKIVGIAGWGFDHFFGSYYQQYQAVYLEIYGEKQIQMHRHDLYLLQKIYSQLIQENPDILFILRYHPGTIDFQKSEFYGLEHYDNVFISNTTVNSDYQISDLINISDLWIGYETTTALEAWLLNKTTFLINPSGSDFIRENIYKGSPVVQSAQEAQNLIDTFFQEGKLELFDTYLHNREKIVNDVIGFGDGKNYQRAGEMIASLLKEAVHKKCINISVLYMIVKQWSKFALAKTIFKRRWRHLICDSTLIQTCQKLYSKAI